MTLQQPVSTIIVTVPLHIRRRGGRKQIVSPAGQGAEIASPQPNTGVVKAIARAWRWQGLLEDGTYATMRDLAAAEKISSSYVCRLMRLTLIEPAVAEELLSAGAGQQ